EAENTLAFIETQLPEVKKALEAAEVRFNDYRRRTGSVDISQESSIILQQSVQAESGILSLQQERKSLLNRFTAEHPSVKALDAQIAALRSEQNRFSGDISRLPSTQQELLRLTRDLQVNQELYTTLLNNAQQLKVVRGGTVGNVRVIDFAQRPLGPVEPKKPLILAVSVLLGLMLGIGFAFVRQMLKSGVKDANQIESKLGLSVLATIPVSEAQEKLFKQISKKGGRLSVLAHAAPDDLSIESLRSLRTSLHFALLDASNNIIMITGPSPQLGKSFVSVNLAAVMAAAGQRVLLVDGDMRRGYLNEYFGMPRDGGLSELIAGQREAEQVIQASGINGFDYVTTGELPPNPSELLLHPRFEAFLKDVSQRYDSVLVDSPPVMAVTDAAIIGRLAGATLLLARFAVTPLRELEHSAKRLQQAGVAVKGVLLNRVEA
ncbi:MAG: polysaccharide biosynthesis tyrosine autokinase, partial [Moraxellaceae bacterium]|nr:polysaccharide biosynthesis tyrosine autokinase [Moraxellaceae bacterium]